MESLEERYRALLFVSETAGAELELPGVLSATLEALNRILRVDAVSVVELRGDVIQARAVEVHGVDVGEGESPIQALRRHAGLPPGAGPGLAPPRPLAGTATEHVRGTGRAHLCRRLGEDETFAEDERLSQLGVLTYVRAPMSVRDRFVGSIAFSRSALHPRGEVEPFTEEDRDFLEAVARPIAASVAHALAFEEIARLKTLLENENTALREDLDRVALFGDVVGSSAAIRRVLAQVEKVAPTDSTVLITGETGTGKELIARAIHRGSPRAERALVKVNVAALPTPLVSAELFGHERGAFTGAFQRRLGRFELAARGTLFLDEIGELPLETQSALLRVLQDGEFERVGGSQTLRTSARVVAATNRDLHDDVESGAFRRDLFYRLNVFPIEVPPLRDRREDIPILVEYFAAQHGRRLGKRVRSVEAASLDRLVGYSWPGNIRELENVVERAIILGDGETLTVDESLLGKARARALVAEPPRSLRDAERRAVEEALAASGGRIAGADGAAARLGVPPSTLDSLIARLGVDKAAYRKGGSRGAARPRGRGPGA
ncbi:MAG: sigma 54-interacting transcriptional regulator [Thermoanaerobaculia bacterium]